LPIAKSHFTIEQVYLFILRIKTKWALLQPVGAIVLGIQLPCPITPPQLLVVMCSNFSFINLVPCDLLCISFQPLLVQSISAVVDKWWPGPPGILVLESEQAQEACKLVGRCIGMIRRKMSPETQTMLDLDLRQGEAWNGGSRQRRNVSRRSKGGRFLFGLKRYIRPRKDLGPGPPRPWPEA
jgi:hypothetical protein